MHLLNQSVNKDLNFIDILTILFVSLLPISLIIGNAAINLNILFINILFLFYCWKYNYWSWLKSKIFIYLIIIYFFLIVNSTYSYYFIVKNEIGGVIRSILFIKFILLIFSISALIKNNSLLHIINKNWLIIISLVMIDVVFEKIFGFNVLGFSSPDQTRIVSFFKDEMVVGGFLLCFGYTTITFFLNKDLDKKNYIYFISILIILTVTIFLTGERANFIKSFLLFSTITIFLKEKPIKFDFKIIFLIFFLISSLIVISNQDTKNRYFSFFKRVLITESNGSILDRFQNIKYIAHFDTAIKIFQNYPISGVGNKNFRVECKYTKYLNKKIPFSIERCSTHPHQIHFEIISEQGIIGYFLIIYFIAFFLINNIKIFFKDKNINHLSNITFIFLFFLPLLPGAGFFSTFNGSLFWIIFSFAYLNYKKGYLNN